MMVEKNGQDCPNMTTQLFFVSGFPYIYEKRCNIDRLDLFFGQDETTKIYIRSVKFVTA